MAKQTQELSYDTKLVLVLVLLFVLYPVGVVLMFKWINWPSWVKWLIAFPVVLFVLGIVLVFSVSVVGVLSGSYNSQKQIEKAQERFTTVSNESICTKQCASSNLNVETCVQKCLLKLNTAK